MDDPVRLKTGGFGTDNALTAFLYELMRDHVVVGNVEEVIRNCPADTSFTLSNRWLAEYAEWCAERLRPDMPSHLFEVHDGEKVLMTSPSLNAAKGMVEAMDMAEDYNPPGEIKILVTEKMQNNEWKVVGEVKI
jgi:hypothetical protein